MSIDAEHARYDPVAVKVPDEELRHLVQQNPDMIVSTLIQLDLHRPVIHYQETIRRGMVVKVLRKVDPLTPEQLQENSDRINSARDLVMETTGIEPNFISVSNTFVARISGADIATIAASNLVKGIYLNKLRT